MKHVKYLIIGAGISGLSTANELLLQGVSKEDILVLEAKDRVGGLIKTDVIDGYTMEWGPEGLRGKSYNTERIFDHYIDVLGVPVTEHSKIRYIGKGDRIIQTPSGPISAVTSPLIPFSGKLRALKEPFVKKYEGDETVAEFVERRLGKHVVPLIDAFVTGVFGGDPHRLSIRHAFPMMKEMEVEYGRLIPGGMKYSKAKKMRLQEAGKLPKAEDPPFLLVGEHGMQGVIEAMAANVDVKLSTAVGKIILQENPIVETSDESYEAEFLVVATGVNALHRIEIIENGETIGTPEMAEAQVMVVTLGFDPESFEKEIRGYGFLIPDSENRFIMGTLYSSRLFEFRAPADKIMLRCFVGGIRHQDRLSLDHDEILKGILSDLDDYLGLKKQPEFTHFMLHQERGIPQLMLDHDEVLRWRNDRQASNSNIYFTGIGWKGIACDVLIEESITLAEMIAEPTSSKKLEEQILQ